jgi:hypothetical protein
VDFGWKHELDGGNITTLKGSLADLSGETLKNEKMSPAGAQGRREKKSKHQKSGVGLPTKVLSLRPLWSRSTLSLSKGSGREVFQLTSQVCQKRFYRMERREIHFLKFILDGYDGMAVLKTVDREKGTVVLYIPPGREEEVFMIIDELKKEIRIEAMEE